MIGATKRSADRARMFWEPLGEVIDALGSWQPTADQLAVAPADSTRRGRPPRRLPKEAEAALLNGVLHASLLPDRASLAPGDVPFVVPVFVPTSFTRQLNEGSVSAVEVLALSVRVDGVPLAELDGLPVIPRVGPRREVTFTMKSTERKVVEDGVLTLSVGFGAGPPSMLSWTSRDGTARRFVLDGRDALPPDAPSWAGRIRVRSAMAPLSPRELSLCYAVASDLGGRATARLLTHFKPMVAGRMRRHAAANLDNVRAGGTPCTEDDRLSDLYECLLLHIRSYVAKAVREDGTYTRDLFAYVTSCFKPAAARAMLTYGPRTGRQDVTGESTRVSELVGSLRQHAAIYRLTDPEAARAHHAVHWILARRFKAQLDTGEMTMDDLWSMWERGVLPPTLRIPEPAMWDVAIGHRVEVTHLPTTAGGSADPGADLDSLSAEEVSLPGAASGEVRSGRRRPAVAAADLELLVHPDPSVVRDHGFFAITAEVAARLAEEAPHVWDKAVGEGRGAALLLRHVMAPFATGATQSQAAARLHDSCTVEGRWLCGPRLLEAWADGPHPDGEGEGRVVGQITGPGGSRRTSTLTDSSLVDPLA